MSGASGPAGDAPPKAMIQSWWRRWKRWSSRSPAATRPARMFNHITMNWRGRPLVTFETVVECIANTRTSTGLRIQAALDERVYERGIQVSEEEIEGLHITRHAFHGEWAYTLHPAPNGSTGS